MSAFLSGNYSEYIGTKNYVRDTFPITHNSLPIFKREFDASDSNIVSIGNSSIFIPSHFFMSGEELEYGYDLDSYHEPIGIANTTVPGIGLTNKLPSKVYVVKINDSSLHLSATAENSLKTNPIIFNFTSLGIGTGHYLKGKNPNKKVLITIDNVIQTPIVSTSATTFLSTNLSFYESIIDCDNARFFSVKDLLKIDDEIMRVESVGFGSLNKLLVKRSFMGTATTAHSAGSKVVKLSGSFSINEDKITFASSPFGDSPKSDPNNPSYVDVLGITTRSTFNGRVFIRSGVPDGAEEVYSSNYIFDDASNNFTGVTSSFTLKIDGENVVGILEDNPILLLNNVIQFPSRSNIDRNYRLEDDSVKTDLYIENPKINQENYDINSTGLPVGGRIVSVGSSFGFGYQPLRSAIGTAVVGIGSTIVSIDVQEGGSGYRNNLQDVYVGIITTGTNVYPIGIASISNGSVSSVTITDEYYLQNPLEQNSRVIFDNPVGYENIPLIYSNQSQPGIGTGAIIDIFVSNNGSVRNFELKNLGYGYKEGDILTIPTELQNSIIGIPTDTSLQFEEFQIYIDQVYSDSFSGWSVGEFEILDSPKKYFDGVRTTFPISANGIQKSIRTAKGSPIDIQSTLVVFLNDILQNPGSGYFFNGGSLIRFAEPPRSEDKCEILFYRGTKDIDVVDVDILETIQIGDFVDIESDDFNYDQNRRLVKDIISVDTLQTNNYPGPGVNSSTTYLRPIMWCKSTEDKIVDNITASKSRISYEPLIYPSTNIIQNVGVGTTALIYVENIKTIFDPSGENLDDKFKGKIDIISQTENKIERMQNAKYYGDFGKVTRVIPIFVETTKPALALSLNIEKSSILEDSLETTSLSVGDYFTIKNSNVGFGLTSLTVSDQQISIGTTFIDNVYQVYSLDAVGEQIFGSITVNGIINYPSPTTMEDSSSLIVDDGSELTIDGESIRIITKVFNHNNLQSSLLQSTIGDYFGDYSWGKINAFKRPDPKSFEVYNNNGNIGINSSPVVRRTYPLKYSDYLL
jgi:hypothetical protein